MPLKRRRRIRAQLGVMAKIAFHPPTSGYFKPFYLDYHPLAALEKTIEKDD
jgi:hypothetical protein